MPNVLIRNVTAITLDDDDRILRDVDIAIEGEIIGDIGRNLVFGKNQVSEPIDAIDVIDGRERVARPAVFNAHTHAAVSLERGWAEDLPFERWLNEKIWVAESALEEEDVYWGAALACCEMLRCGVIGFADHYFWR